MIFDEILDEEYDGKNCKICGTDNILLIHDMCVDGNPKDDYVFCRCEYCDHQVLNNNGEPFSILDSAIRAWNED